MTSEGESFDPALARTLDWSWPSDDGTVRVKLLVEASAAPFPDISIYPAVGEEIAISGPGRAVTAVLLSVEVAAADRTFVVLRCDGRTARLLGAWRTSGCIFGFEFFPAPALLCLPVAAEDRGDG